MNLFQKIKNCFRLQFKQLFPCYATLDSKFLMFDSQQYLFKPFIYQFTTVPFKTFIYLFTTVIKYDPQNLQNLEFPIPFRPLFNSKPIVRFTTILIYC